VVVVELMDLTDQVVLETHPVLRHLKEIMVEMVLFQLVVPRTELVAVVLVQ
jgi:hypothetical protein